MLDLEQAAAPAVDRIVGCAAIVSPSRSYFVSIWSGGRSLPVPATLDELAARRARKAAAERG